MKTRFLANLTIFAIFTENTDFSGRQKGARWDRCSCVKTRIVWRVACYLCLTRVFGTHTHHSSKIQKQFATRKMYLCMNSEPTWYLSAGQKNPRFSVKMAKIAKTAKNLVFRFQVAPLSAPFRTPPSSKPQNSCFFGKIESNAFNMSNFRSRPDIMVSV